MSLLYLVECDGCRFVADDCGSIESAAKARRNVKAAGWSRRGGKDYCQECSRTPAHLTDEQEAEAQRLYSGMLENIESGKTWGLDPKADQ